MAPEFEHRIGPIANANGLLAVTRRLAQTPSQDAAIVDCLNRPPNNALEPTARTLDSEFALRLSAPVRRT